MKLNRVLRWTILTVAVVVGLTARARAYDPTDLCQWREDVCTDLGCSAYVIPGACIVIPDVEE